MKMPPVPEYIPEGKNKSKKMLSDNLQTTDKYREGYDRIFKKAYRRVL